MEQRLSIVTLGVGDLAGARRFYEALGWKVSKAGNEHIVFFQLHGMALGLYARTALAEDACLPDTGANTGFGGMTLAYNARDKAEVDLVLREALAAGARLLKPAHDAFWGGYSGYFADPDGHPWEVAFNPHWALQADGSVRLP